LHLAGIVFTVVVAGAELVPPARRIGAIERDRRIEVEDLRIAVVRRGEDRRAGFGRAVAGRDGVGDGRPTLLLDARAPDTEELAALVGVRAELEEARALRQGVRSAV